MRRIDEKDRLKGGVDVKDVGKYLNRFQPNEVSKGIAVEKEHTNSTAIAKEIASDHLGEDPHYYSKLKKIHKESIDVFEFNFHDILEWDDDVPLGTLVQKVKEPAAPKEKPRSAYHARQIRQAANKIKRAELHAQGRHNYKLDIMKSGVTGNALATSLDMFDRDAPPAHGRIRSGPVSKSHNYARHTMGFSPLKPGKESKSEKQKVVPSSWLPPRKVAAKPVPVVEPVRAKNAVDNAFKSKKSDPRYSSTVNK